MHMMVLRIVTLPLITVLIIAPNQPTPYWHRTNRRIMSYFEDMTLKWIKEDDE